MGYIQRNNYHNDTHDENFERENFNHILTSTLDADITLENDDAGKKIILMTLIYIYIYMNYLHPVLFN